MPLKTVTAQVGDTEIKVENTWFHGARLLVNGQEIARDDHYFALNRSRPVMSAKALIDGSERLIEVYAFAIFTVRIKVFLDGRQIAGDRF